MTDYDAIVLGAGQAGPGVAAGLAGQGKRTALVEMDRVGGTCLNHGCKPTKALRASAVVAATARRAAVYGVSTGEVTVDLVAALDRVHAMINQMRASLREWIDSVDGLDFYEGLATLRTDPSGQRHEVAVAGQTHAAAEVYLNVGARAAAPPLPGLDTVDYLTEVELLALDRLPEHLVVIGGGYLGCEFGQMFRRFGAPVTLLGRPMAREDDDVSGMVSAMLTEEGVRVVTAHAERVARTDGGIEVTLVGGGTVSGSHLLVATGRRANSDLLGDHGLATDADGFFTVDDRFATSVPGVWALGDINRRGAWTHTAYQDGQIVLDPRRDVGGRVPAYAMFTDPPLGRVGMDLAEARRSGRRVLKAEVPMSSVSRAILEGETTGLMRVLVDADTEEFLGATILGLHADDLVQVISTAMQAGVGYPTVRDQLPIHPTMAEYIPFVLASLQPLEE